MNGASLASALAPTALALGFALVGCAGAGDLAPASGPPTADTLTWYQDVEPVVDRWCSRCHRPDGPGSADFTDPGVVSLLAEYMLARIDAGEMPPPVADPDCRPYWGHEELTLPVDARDLFARWIDEGKALGDAADSTSTGGTRNTTLEDADLEVRLEVPYTPTFTDPSDPGNEYRCFALEHGRDEDFFITGLAPLLDQERLVHHIVLFRIGESSLWPDYDPAVGVDCIDDMAESVLGMIAGWAPGAVPIEFPQGTGIKILANQRIGMQIHYFQNGEAGLADQTGYAFRTATEVDDEVRMVPIGTTSFNIPAGDAAYTRSGSWSMPLGIAPIVHGVFPHMHVLGRAFSMVREGSDGSRECMVDMPRYDFANQQSYLFEWPIELEPDDRISFSCTWDNSADNPDQLQDPPQDVRYGERTDEEMCYGFTFIQL
jgi:hypothetical protein